MVPTGIRFAIFKDTMIPKIMTTQRVTPNQNAGKKLPVKLMINVLIAIPKEPSKVTATIKVEYRRSIEYGRLPLEGIFRQK